MSQGKNSSSSDARLRTRNSNIETRAQRIVTMTATVRRPAKISSLSQPYGDLSKDTGFNAKRGAD